MVELQEGAERLTGGGSIDPGFSVLVGIAGSGTLAMEGGDVPFERGSAVLVPFAGGAGELQGDVEALRARPPHLSAGEGRW